MLSLALALTRYELTPDVDLRREGLPLTTYYLLLTTHYLLLTTDYRYELTPDVDLRRELASRDAELAARSARDEPQP